MSYSLSFSKSILVVIFVADKMRQGQFQYLSTAYISEILDIPKPTLVKIFQSLHAENIIETKEGKQGGIRLLKDPAQITILDIFQAIEKGKPLFQSSFNILAKGKRPDAAQVTIQNLFAESESQMKRVLAQKTIGQILEDMSQ
jgi:Rrf2 family protein